MLVRPNLELTQLLTLEMREKYIEYIKLIVTAIGITLLLNLEIILLSPNLIRLLEWIRLILVFIIPITILLLAIFLWRLIVPHRIQHKAIFSIYYDVNEGKIIPFMFEMPFLPQDTARQVLNMLIDRQPNLQSLLKEDVGQTFHTYYEKRIGGHQLHENDRPLWSHYVEYLLLQWTKGWALHFAKAQRQHLLKLVDVTYKELPATLKTNPVIQLLAGLKPENIIEASHAQILFSLPADLKLMHSCSLHEPRTDTEYLDWGTIRMKNRYLTVSLTFHGFHFWGLVSVFIKNASPNLAGIPVSPQYNDYFETHLPNLRRVAFSVELQMDFAIRYQMFGRIGKVYHEMFDDIAREFIDAFDESNYIARAVAARRDRLWDKLAEMSQNLADKEGKGFD